MLDVFILHGNTKHDNLLHPFPCYPFAAFCIFGFTAQNQIWNPYLVRPELRVDEREEHDGGHLVVALVLEDVALLHGLIVEEVLHSAADLGKGDAV